MLIIFLLLLIKLTYIISLETSKKYLINRYIPNFVSSSEELFFPYNYSSTLDFIDGIIDGGIYVFDTASFYIWKNTPFSNNSDITIPTRYNDKISGKVNNSSNLIWINLDTKEYQKNFGSIAIPINIPNNIKENITKTDNKIYNYLDYIKDDINQNYINYIQTSINSGYILFGKKDEIFDVKKNDNEIKTCKCSHPEDIDDVQYDFLNYWNCKINTFSVDNIKLSSLYSKSINGDIYAIIALSEEYIIAPKKTGEEIINYYKDLIGKKNCNMESFKTDMKILVCKKFNFAELPDFTITLEGEISLNAFSYDLFKNKNETHIYFKILLNQLDTKEYWYIGDPIIKNYNFLFDYNKHGEEQISIVPSNKYDSFAILLTSGGATVITLIFFGFLLFARIKINILSKNKKKNQNEKARKTTKKIKKIIRNQNDFDIPEGNIPIRNMLKNSNLMNEDNLEELINEENSINNIELNKEIISSDCKSSISNTDNSINKSFESENNLQKKIKNLKKSKNSSNEYEMNDLSKLMSFDEGECEMLGDNEGSIPPLKKSKFS